MNNEINSINTSEEKLKKCLEAISNLKLALEEDSTYNKKYIEIQGNLINQLEIKKKAKEVLKEYYGKKVNVAIKFSVIASLMVSAILVICFTTPVALGLAATIIALTSIVVSFASQKSDAKLKIIEGDISILNNEIEIADHLKKEKILKQENLSDKNEILALIEHYENIVYEILEDENLVETEYVKEVKKIYYSDSESVLEQKKLIKVKHNEV